MKRVKNFIEVSMINRVCKLKLLRVVIVTVLLLVVGIYISPQQIVNKTEAGTFLDEGLRFPYTMTVDSQGSIYVLDRGNNSGGFVKKYDSSGNFLTQWGSDSQGSGDGQFYFTCTGCKYGILATVEDGSNYIYVADLHNYRVQKFDSEGNFILKWGSNGTGDGQFRFNSHYGKFAVSYEGEETYIFVLDAHNNRIQKFDTEGNFILKWGSSGTGDGQFSFTGDIDTGSLDIYQDEDDNFVFVLDNNRVQKFDLDGNFISKWGSLGSGDGQFNEPRDIKVSPEREIFITDEGHQKILVFDIDGNFIEDIEIPVHASDIAFDSEGGFYLNFPFDNDNIDYYGTDQEITLTSPYPNTFAYTSPPSLIEGTVWDSLSVTSVEYQIDGTNGAWILCEADSGTFEFKIEDFTCSIETNNPLETGEHTIYVRATNGLGNPTSEDNYADYTFEIDPSVGPVIVVDTIVVLDSESGDTGVGNSIAIGPDGFPKISYVDYENSDFYLIICHDERCSDFDKVLVDIDSTGYPVSSIAIGNDGFARMVYSDGNLGLKYAKCTNTLCSNPVITSIDPTSDLLYIYYGLEIHIGSDGLAKIAYTDYNNPVSYTHLRAHET